jgi:hypothetical protein
MHDPQSQYPISDTQPPQSPMIVSQKNLRDQNKYRCKPPPRRPRQRYRYPEHDSPGAGISLTREFAPNAKLWYNMEHMFY